MHVLLNIRHILFLKYLFGIMHVSRRSSQLIICTPFVAENGDADVVVMRGTNVAASRRATTTKKLSLLRSPSHRKPSGHRQLYQVIFALSEFAFLHRSPLLSLDRQFNDRWMINEVLSADVSHKVEPVNGGSATNL